MRQRQTGHPEPIGRSSLRSKASKESSGGGTAGSASAGASDGQRMRRFKDCCRITLEFTFTQVGVGALVVAYTIMGAFIFQYLETQGGTPFQSVWEMIQSELQGDRGGRGLHFISFNLGIPQRCQICHICNFFSLIGSRRSIIIHNLVADHNGRPVWTLGFIS